MFRIIHLQGGIAMLSYEENKILTETGPGTPMGNLLRRYWVPALTSEELPEPDCPPVRLKIMSENLVAFRDSNNQVAIFDEHCPHRRASLFFGRNEECGLRCVYHGWKFDATGQCVDMPSEPAESNFKDSVRVKSYPCREAGGVIWTYMGPPELMPELPPLLFLSLDKSHVKVTRYIHENNYFQGLEGALDSSHISFLHRRKSENVSEISKVTHRFGNPKFEVAKTDYGLLIGARRNTDIDNKIYWRITQYVMPWYSIIPPIKLHSTHEDTGHLVSWVPMDDNNSIYWRVTWDPVKPLDPDNLPHSHAPHEEGSLRPQLNKDNLYMMDRELQASGKSFTGIMDIPAEDQAMNESQGPIADRTKEKLGTSDTAIIVARRVLINAAKALEQGEVPPGLNANVRIRAASVMLDEGVPFQEGAKEFLVLKA